MTIEKSELQTLAGVFIEREGGNPIGSIYKLAKLFRLDTKGHIGKIEGDVSNLLSAIHINELDVGKADIDRTIKALRNALK